MGLGGSELSLPRKWRLKIGSLYGKRILVQGGSEQYIIGGFGLNARLGRNPPMGRPDGYSGLSEEGVYGGIVQKAF
jgi:hypothetical protein